MPVLSVSQLTVTRRGTRILRGVELLGLVLGGGRRGGAGGSAQATTAALAAMPADRRSNASIVFAACSRYPASPMPIIAAISILSMPMPPLIPAGGGGGIEPPAIFILSIAMPPLGIGALPPPMDIILSIIPII